ncbi:glycosyltransferase family 4 protein [Rhizobium sp. CC-YZS058]|uniref:glycosyltransferase family 4 protein n=1 Tax=Rhizobium sp. CC-YZS058 TaxID=3042153 RepID=UPI002B057C06|nr:glycosyltransferase family 4 protein [Rhizobium sp. CC-YZS058]MEA3535452.1 glycosyltransferase family 4 protein [Rhizobium sp. CC-YZS058]
MRILHLLSLYPPHVLGGCELSVRDLAEEQVQMGHTVGAACIERQAEPKTVINGVTVYRMFHNNDFWIEDGAGHSSHERRMQKIKQQWNFNVERQFEQVLDDFKPDLLNTHSLLDVPTLVWRAAARRKIPIVHTICEYDLICGNAAMFRRGENCNHIHMGCKVVNFSKKFTQRHIAGVASVSHETLRIHTDNGFFHHIPERLRRVIYYSCSVPDGDPVARAQIDRSGRPLTFGYIGRINTEKGVGTMVEAFKQIGQGNWKCLVAGKALDDSVERFKAEAGDLPIEFLGFTKPKDLYDQVDVLIVPSIWAEPSPRTIYEAFFMGVPCIGAKSGGIPELIGEHQPDYLFEPGNVNELADRIRRLLTKSREEIVTEYDFGNVVEESTSRRVGENYDRLYQDVMASAGKSFVSPIRSVAR